MEIKSGMFLEAPLQIRYNTVTVHREMRKLHGEGHMSKLWGCHL